MTSGMTDCPAKKCKKPALAGAKTLHQSTGRDKDFGPLGFKEPLELMRTTNVKSALAGASGRRG